VSRLRYALAGRLGAGVVRALMATVRTDVQHQERYAAFASRGEPVIFCLWHGRLLPLVYHLRGRDIAAMISQSEDGEYIAGLVRGWDYRPVRGSTSRGGSRALLQLVHEARAGHSIAITPDGPRGPRQKLQHGVITVAHRTGLPIVPLACGCTRAWWPGSWDRFCVPKPFSKVVIRYGAPYRVPGDRTREELEMDRIAVEERMNRMIEEIDRDVGGPTR
jgi:hypothetical protein